MGLPKPCTRTAFNCYRTRWLPSPVASPRHAALLRNRCASVHGLWLSGRNLLKSRVSLRVRGHRPAIGPVEEIPPRVGSVLGQLRVAEREADGRQVVGTGSVEMPAELREFGAARDCRVVFLLRWLQICLGGTASRVEERRAYRGWRE